MNPAFWRGRRVFVTGHTGFKGSWLCLWLTQLGAQVSGFALAPDTEPALFDQAGVAAGMHSTLGDVRDLAALQAALHAAQPEVVLHLAAQPLVRHSYADPVGTYATNVMGTVNLLQAVRGCASVRAVVVVTSDKCYENRESSEPYREHDAMGGHDPYSSSKGCAELVCAAYRNSFFAADIGTTRVGLATARAGNVIGGGDWARDRLVPDVLRAAQADTSITLRNPNATRPWQHVLEPLAGYLMLAERLHANPQRWAGGWNFGPAGHDVQSVQWIADALSALLGRPPARHLDQGPQPHEAQWLALNNGKARTQLGWVPHWDLRQALTAIVEWHSAAASGLGPREISLQQIARYQALWRAPVIPLVRPRAASRPVPAGTHQKASLHDLSPARN